MTIFISIFLLKTLRHQIFSNIIKKINILNKNNLNKIYLKNRNFILCIKSKQKKLKILLKIFSIE